MSAKPDVLRVATGVLADHAKRQMPGAAPRGERDMRGEIVAQMQARMQARVVEQRRRTWAARFAVAAGAILLALGAGKLATRPSTSLGALVARAPTGGEIVATGRLLDGAATAWHDGRPSPVAAGFLASGDRVVTAAGAHAEIALSTGTSVVLAPSADVTFTHVERAQTFAVTSGGVNARVAKLHQGERFLVRTSDTEVEVRGTVFEVTVVAPDPSCGDGTSTRVAVSEGVVVVRNHGVETRVAAGERWPAGCVATPPVIPSAASLAPTASASACPSTSTATSSAPLSPGAYGAPAALAPASAAPPAPLALRNDLFNEALAAKYRGDLPGALAGFESYLAKFPDGEHVESASVQRMRILAKLDRPRAELAARAYLARNPQGFAREEAEALVGASATQP
jgi:hypothetical protein